MKPTVCKHCSAVDSHFSFQCPSIRKPIKKKGTPIGSFVMTKKDASKPIKKSKPISPISSKRKEALKRYRRLRDKYFSDHPICEFPDCTSTKITLHHMCGRIGAFLTDKRHFKSLCIKHHRWAEENPVEAIKLGLSKKRLDKYK